MLTNINKYQQKYQAKYQQKYQAKYQQMLTSPVNLVSALTTPVNPGTRPLSLIPKLCPINYFRLTIFSESKQPLLTSPVRPLIKSLSHRSPETHTITHCKCQMDLQLLIDYQSKYLCFKLDFKWISNGFATIVW